MLPNDLALIDEAYLVAMCAEQRPESQRLDFKRVLPDARDRQWRDEFSKDLCALANTEGGDIVYGIREANACADGVEAITAETQDAALRRLGQVADARIQPRIVGLHFHAVLVQGGYVLVLRVPQSLGGPHGYAVNDALRFPMRVRTHTSDMSYEQLRNSFDRAATLRERAREFRSNQIQKLTARQTWVPMQALPLLVVHFIPLQAFAGADLIDVARLYNDYGQFNFRRWPGASRSLHLDGLAVYVPRRAADQSSSAYVQVFRSGALEAVHTAGVVRDNRYIIGGVAVAELVVENVTKFLAAANHLQIRGPAVMGIALLDVANWEFAFSDYEVARSDRQHLVLPETWIERAEAVENPESVWRPMVDMLWQCFDLERCAAFDEQRPQR